MATTPRGCERHDADGTRCRRRTTSPTRWCGLCDGYRTPIPITSHHPGWRAQAVVNPPLTLDQVPAVRITRTAHAQYLNAHRGWEATVDPEVRAVLAYLITHGYWQRRSNGSYGSINAGYGLTVSAHLDSVTYYSCMHPDHTIGQYTSGILPRDTTEPAAVNRTHKAVLRSHATLWDPSINEFVAAHRQDLPVTVGLPGPDGTTVRHGNHTWTYPNWPQALAAARRWTGDEPRPPHM